MKNINSNYRKPLLMATSVWAITGVGSALAQELEEIVVTAQKRAENLQDVPISVSAFTADTLEKFGIASTMDLSMVTPGLQMTQQLGNSMPTLRGIGTGTSAAGNENPISTYVDGVYLPNMASNNFTLNNIERIEVLKGPQGTLFGRNATGGLINVITKDPTQETSGSFEVFAGNYETSGVNGYVSGELTDRVAADLAIYHQDQSDYYGTNRGTGSGRGYSEASAARSKIIFEPSDETRLKLAVMYSESESDIGINRQTAPGSLGFDGLLTFLGCGATPECAAPAIAAASTYTGDWHDINGEFDSRSIMRNWYTSLHFEHSFDSVNFLSITAYSENHSLHHLDQDGTPLPVVDARLFTDSENFTQEFQFTSSNDGPFQWITGFFYMDSTEEYNPFNLTGLVLPVAETFNNPVQDTKSYSAYIQGAYNFTDATRLTVGVRFTEDERKATVNTIASFTPGGPQVLLEQGSIKETWTEPTWRIALDHQLNDDMLVYGSYSRGFKSGLFNLVSVTMNPQSANNKPADPEIIDAYEIGLKTDIVDNSVRFNASVFYYEYQDIQIQDTAPGGTALVNATESEILGLEAELIWLATNNLNFSAGLSVLDTEYTDWENATVYIPTGVGGNAAIIQNVSGASMIRTPDLTYNIGIDYSLPTENGLYNANIAYYYNDGFNWEVSGRLVQKSYSLVNSELSWSSPGETWKLRIYGRNLTDEEYSTVSDTGDLGDAVSAAPPRTFGAGVEYNF